MASVLPDPQVGNEAARLLFRPDTIPTALKYHDRWVGWRCLPRPDGLACGFTKPPVDHRTGLELDTLVDPRSWLSFSQALAWWERDETIAGLGLVLDRKSPLVVLDLDYVLDAEGKLPDPVCDWLDCLDTYTEISPSGNGLHVYLYSSTPPRARVSYQFGNYIAEVHACCPLYTRYAAVTGHSLGGQSEPKTRTHELARVLREWARDGTLI